MASARAMTLGRVARFKSTGTFRRVDADVLRHQPTLPTSSTNGTHDTKMATFPMADHIRSRAAREKHSCGGRWTDTESEKLVSLVRNSLRETACPQWGKICVDFPNRSKRAVTIKFYRLQPGVLSQTKMKWSVLDTKLAMLCVRQRAPPQEFIASLPGHTPLSILDIGGMLRNYPKRMGAPMESHRQVKHIPYSDPLPRRHKQKWDADDLERLKRLRQLSLQADWSYISGVLGRTLFACYAKFGHLRRSQDILQFPVPDVGDCVSTAGKSAEWSESEIQKLVACITASEDGPSWSELLDTLPGRTAGACCAKLRIISKSFARKHDGRPKLSCSPANLPAAAKALLKTGKKLPVHRNQTVIKR